MTRRYPIQPLATLMGMVPGTALDRLGVSGTTAKEYRTRGVTERVADRLATRAGYHPAEVWPEWLDHAIADSARPCEECGTPFVPANPRHRFCHRNCASRRWQRRKYQTDAEYRAEEIAKRRQRYRECCEYERARQRRYRREKNEETQEGTRTPGRATYVDYKDGSNRGRWTDHENHRANGHREPQAAIGTTDETQPTEGAA